MTAMHGLAEGPACPAPVAETERIQLGHGSGGKLSAELLRTHFLPRFGNPILLALGDGAVVPGAETLVVSTDSFVVRPLEFPGGNIGHLAVHGTLNDVAMMGAVPRYLTGRPGGSTAGRAARPTRACGPRPRRSRPDRRRPSRSPARRGPGRGTG